MTGIERGALDRRGSDEDGEVGEGARTEDEHQIRVKCTTDPARHELDVRWTKGAIFEFPSFEDADRWVADESGTVPGTFYLAEAPSQARLSVGYYVKYNSPDG